MRYYPIFLCSTPLLSFMLGIVVVQANVSLFQPILFPRTKELAAYQGMESWTLPDPTGVLYALALRSCTATALYNVLPISLRHYEPGHLAGFIRTILPEYVRKFKAPANPCRTMARQLRVIRCHQAST